MPFKYFERINFLSSFDRKNCFFLVFRKDDLVVGAPFLHKAGHGGAVYVYINGPKVSNINTSYFNQILICS